MPMETNPSAPLDPEKNEGIVLLCRFLLFLVGFLFFVSIISGITTYFYVGWQGGKNIVPGITIDSGFEMAVFAAILLSIFSFIPAVIMTVITFYQSHNNAIPLALLGGITGVVAAAPFLSTKLAPILVLPGVGWASGYILHFIAVRISDYFWRRW